ncbi:MAG TPA: DUF4185 domain-containing protein [Corynebacteriales bacterium]|nr:DUF4185 domain-containing protein [Mycobacteriales bacterium]
MKLRFRSAIVRSTMATFTALIMGVGTFAAAPMAVADPQVSKNPTAEPPIPSFARPMVPDPVPIRNGRTGLVLLPADPYSATVKTGLTPALGFNCPACRRADVWGGDVAVSWDDGKGGTFIIFGDTIGFDYYLKPRMRSNTLAWTRDRNYDNGLQIEKWLLGKDGKAKEAIPSAHKNGFERSKIPTGAFSHKGVQYVGWQSVSRVVNDSRRWLTSRSGLSASYDHGKTWQTVFTRPQGAYYQFQQVSYAKRGNYLYEFGTRQGRQLGGLGVARVRLDKVQNLAEREYWTGIRWAKNEPMKALSVLPGFRGEVSVQWDPFFRRFNLLRVDSAGVVLHTSLNGVIWSPGREIYNPRSTRYSIYAPQLLPNRRGANLNFLLSVWQDYNVVTMYTPLGF